MNTLSVFLIAVGLASDAFSVAVAKGISIKSVRITDALKIAFMFGSFQFFMPFAGLCLGSEFMKAISSFAEVAASSMLFIIGGKMVYDALFEKTTEDGKTTFSNLIIPALATSIDALAVGFTLACFDTKILFCATVIGLTAFVLSFLGVYIGKKFGAMLGKYAGALGGMVLILLALKFLFDFFC